VKPRPHQEEAVTTTLQKLQEHGSSLIVMPTGTGKTFVFSEMIRRTPGRAMVVAHREELIEQAARTIERVTGERPSIEMAEQKSRENLGFGLFANNSVVASVQTLNAKRGRNYRMDKFNPNDFSLLIIDEAHHAVANTYQRVIKHFQKNTDLMVCGVSATPDRQDKLALGQVFNSVGYQYEIFQAIQDGWLVPIISNQIVVESLDFDHVRKTAGDLNQKDLSQIVEKEASLHGVATPCIEIAGDRKTLVFATSVAQAKDLCGIINRHGRRAVFLHGGTPKDERREIVRRYLDGEYQFLCNVGIATEGFDDPSIKAVAIARPTLSRALYTQMAGRGTRPLPGVVDAPISSGQRREAIANSDKPNVEIIDFVGNSTKHKLVSSTDILGGKYNDKVVDRARMIAKESGKPVDLISLMERASREQEEAEEEVAKLTARGDIYGVTAKAKYLQKKGDPFDVLSVSPERIQKVHTRTLTGPQLGMLKRNGVDVSSLNNHQQVTLHNEMIRRLKANLCTYKQAKILKKYGYGTNVSFKQATQTITRIANNGWRRPD
jgi:superfamily II DNA or RNA helicase